MEDRHRFVEIDFELRAPAMLTMISPPLFVLAGVLAWWRACRRARSAVPGSGRAG